MLGTGIVKGLVVTAKNLAGSFHDPERFTTIQYPEERTRIPEAYRNFPFLVTETDEDPMGALRCVACQICEKECPPQCIYIEKSKDKKPDANGRMQFYPAVFDIDTSVCMSCQICVEVCPFDAIKMDHDFEIATGDRFEGLLLRREQLAKSNDYFRRIRPAEAAEVDGRLAAARQAAAKPKPAAAATPGRPVRQAGSPAPSPAPGGAAPAATVVASFRPSDGPLASPPPANPAVAPVEPRPAQPRSAEAAPSSPAAAPSAGDRGSAPAATPPAPSASAGVRAPAATPPLPAAGGAGVPPQPPA